MFASTAVLSLLAGIALVMMGLSYRWGQDRGIKPEIIMWGAAAAGTLVFGVRCMALHEFSRMGAKVAIWGISAGFGQLIAVYVLAAALKRGSFAPVWCALTLTFIPVALYSAFFTPERQSPWQWGSILLAVACVVVASTERRTQPAAANSASTNTIPAPPSRAGPLFGSMLLLLMFSAGLTNIGIKDLGTVHDNGPALLPDFSGTYLFLLYGILFLGITVKGLIVRRPIPKLRAAVPPVLLAAAGSLLALACLMQAGTAPNVVIFVVSSTLSVMGGFIGAAVFFGDALTGRSWAVISLGLLSVGCIGVLLATQS